MLSQGYNSPFEKRAQAFKTLVPAVFGAHPQLAAALDKLIEDAKQKVINRNLLAHGRFSFSNTDGEKLITKGRYKGKEREIEYSFPDIEQLFFDLSHIAGRFYLFTIPEAFLGGKGIPLPSHEIEFLVDFCKTTLRKAPTSP